MRVVAYHKVFELPIAGYVLKSIGALGIKMANTKVTETNKYDKESVRVLMEKCKQLINDGYTLFMFPEGKRNIDPSHVNEIRGGAYNLSADTGRPIQILVLKGVHNIWSATGYPDGFGTITVTKYEEPITFSSVDEYRDRVTNVMKQYISDRSDNEDTNSTDKDSIDNEATGEVTNDTDNEDNNKDAPDQEVTNDTDNEDETKDTPDAEVVNDTNER